MLELTKVKEYLRVDDESEDALITSLILTAEELVEGVIRCPLDSFEEVPETLKQAIMFSVATMYENRQGGKGGLDMYGLIDILKRMCFAYRKEAW